MFTLPCPSRLAASFLLAATTILSSGCHAQPPVPAPGSSTLTMTPAMTRRVALLIRQKAQLPFNYDVQVSDRKASLVTGYDEVTVSIGEYGKPLKPMQFLISKDNRTLAQMNTFDLSKDPAGIVSDAGRPGRGGDEKAPVKIVVYDDLECPFCARMHAQMFPALTARYGKNVRVVYKDFPLTQIHPWGLHAAIDADCLATENAAAYWNYVDGMHAKLDEIGLDTSVPPAPGKEREKTLPVALKQLDRAALDEGAKQHVDAKRLSACIERQDETAVKVYMKEGEALNISGVPALFINGEQITGAVPIEYVFKAVDAALVAQGVTPPPAVALPDLNAPAAASPAAK